MMEEKYNDSLVAIKTEDMEGNAELQREAQNFIVEEGGEE